jgi:hypothetical protein
MRCQHLGGIDTVIVQEPIGRLNFRSPLASCRKLQGGLLAHSVHDDPKTLIQPFVTESRSSQFLFYPRLHDVIL